MLYKEKELKQGSYYHSFCTDNLGEKYPKWIVPCRVLGISPAEWIKLLITEYNAIVTYNPGDGGYYKETILFKWAEQKDERKYRNMLNKVAREKNFQI